MAKAARSRRPKRAVRGGSIWHGAQGMRVRVVTCRTMNPMRAVRPHSDMRWRLVMYERLDRPGFGVVHEEDFRKQFSWVRGRPHPIEDQPGAS